MSEKILDQLQKLLLADDGLLISLRMGEGFDQQKFKELCNILKECNEEWEDKEVIPKKIAHVFIDIYPSMWSSSYLYSEEKAKKIREAADKSQDLIKEILAKN